MTKIKNFFFKLWRYSQNYSRYSQNYSRYILNILNKTYNSMEWCLNLPPKPHEFISLPLYSGWGFFKTTYWKKRSFYLVLTQKIKSLSFWCNIILSTLFIIGSRLFIYSTFDIKIEQEIFNLSYTGFFFAFLIAIFKFILKMFSSWLFDEEVMKTHYFSNNHLLDNIKEKFNARQKMHMGNVNTSDNKLSKPKSNAMYMDSNPNDKGKKRYIDKDIPESSSYKGKGKAPAVESSSDSYQESKRRKLNQGSSKAESSKNILPNVLGLESNFSKNASKTDYTPLTNNREIMPWVNIENDSLEKHMPRYKPSKSAWKAYRNSTEPCSDYMKNDWVFPSKPLNIRIIDILSQSRSSTSPGKLIQLFRANRPLSWSDSWCYDVYKHDSLENIIKPRVNETALDYKNRILELGSQKHKFYNKDFSILLSKYFEYNNEHLENWVHIMLCFKSERDLARHELNIDALKNIQNLRQTILQDAYVKGFISEKQHYTFSRFASHILVVETNALKTPIQS